MSRGAGLVGRFISTELCCEEGWMESPPAKLAMGEMIYLSGYVRWCSSQRPHGLQHFPME